MRRIFIRIRSNHFTGTRITKATMYGLPNRTREESPAWIVNSNCVFRTDAKYSSDR